MEMFLTILAITSASLALRSHFYSEVVRLAGRTTDLEKSLTALDARARALPVRVSDLQQNLAALRILTNALGISLGQAQRALSSTRIQSSLAKPFSRTFEARTGRAGDASVDERDESPRP